MSGTATDAASGVLARPGSTDRAASLRPGWRRAWSLAAVALAALLGAALLGVVIGSVAIPPQTVVTLLLERLLGLPASVAYPQAYSTILFEIRLPRVTLMALTGAALAAAGASYQGLFRNP